MYKTNIITERMVENLKVTDIELYEKYIRMTKRGIEFSVAQFFMYFSDRGIGKSFMMWINAIDSFMNNEYEIEKYFDLGLDDQLISIIHDYFKDIKILKKSKNRILIAKI